jgi:putative transcriptional regulator
MIRFRLAERIAAKERLLGRRLSLGEISEATGISVQTISNLRAPRAVVTNTAYVEALCSYFECEIGELVEFDPPIGPGRPTHVDQLYPERRGGRGTS